MKKIEFTDEQQKDIIDLYVNQKKSMVDIGTQYGVSKTVISRVLKENQITYRNDNHKYKANYRIFENIDNKEKAYWLGFFAADGYVYQRSKNNSGNFCGINISRKDREHLEKLRKFMDSNVKIIDHIQTEGFSNNTPMSKIIFNSNEMVSDLINKGVVPRKSLILEPPKIKEEFYLPYILGYFDGDGSIFQTKNKEFGINFIGTKETLEWIKRTLKMNNPLEQKNNANGNNYYIRCGGIQKPYFIMKQLYDSCPSIYLERKHTIYKNLETVVLSRNAK